MIEEHNPIDKSPDLKFVVLKDDFEKYEGQTLAGEKHGLGKQY